MPSSPSKNHVIGLVAQNENEALRAGSSHMDWWLTAYGYTHEVIDLKAPGSGAVLGDALRKGHVAFAYGNAGVGAQLLGTDNVNLWTATRTPFVAFWYDHPAYNYRQHIVRSPYVLHCYFVRDHFEARQKYLPDDGYETAFVMPIGLNFNHAAWDIRWEDKERKILYAKTALQPGIWAKDWDRHPKALREILWALAEEAKRDRNLDLADAAAVLFQARTMSLHDLDVFMGTIQEVDAYIRAWRSDRLARALLPHDARIIGRGWEYLSDEPHRAEILPPISAYDLPLHLARHRIVANTNPLWRDGVHERVGFGVGSYDVVLTDRTVRSDQMFGSLPNYVGFEWGDDLEDVIAESWKKADDPEGYKKISYASIDKLRHTEANFFQPLEEAIERARQQAPKFLAKGV